MSAVTSYKYWAFLSYSHQDNLRERADGATGCIRWAEWLHESLETWKVPPEFLPRQTLAGEPMPDRFYPVFQDEKELPLNSDLASSIRTALEQSRFLIVICSPRSARSFYVNEEVRYFKELGRFDRILALIVDGEPNASEGNKPGLPVEAECFCPALRHPLAPDGQVDPTCRDSQEPIAGDVRVKAGEQPREARDRDIKMHRDVLDYMKLKLVAGLMGVGFDALAQRDKARAIAEGHQRAKVLRRWLAAVGLLAVLAVAGGCFGWWNEQVAEMQRKLAVQNADLAETQRQQAETQKKLAVQNADLAETQRRQAEAQKKLAVQNADLAEAQRQKAVGTLSHSDFLQGVALIANHRQNEALAYLARSVSLNPKNKAALMRLMTLLTYHSWMLPTLTLKHDGGVTLAHFSADGRWIVTGSADQTARVWDAQTGQPVAGPFEFKDHITGAEFSPDGTRVVIASWDKKARVWDVATGKPVTDWVTHPDGIYSAHFSPDGHNIITATINGFWIWNASTGQKVCQQKSSNGTMHDAKFSPDGKWVLVVNDGGFEIWDWRAGRRLTQPLDLQSYVYSANFSPNGKQVITASADHLARVWNALDTSKDVASVQHDGPVCDAEISPNDNQWIATASKDNTARIWAQDGDGGPVTESLKHDGFVTSVQFSPNGKHIVTASADGTARVWDVKQGQSVKHIGYLYPVEIGPIWLEHSGPVYTAEFSRDGKRIATASADGTAKVWDRVSGPALSWFQFEKSNCPGKFSPDGTRFLTVTEATTADLWDVATGKLIASLKHAKEINDLQFSPDGTLIATASKDATVRLWHADTGQSGMDPLKLDAAATLIKFSPDGHLIAAASDDNMIRIWNVQTGQPVTAPIKQDGSTALINFSKDGRWLVTLGDAPNEMAQVWNTRTATLVTPPLPLKGDCSEADISLDGKWLITSDFGADSDTQVWNLQDGKPVDWLGKAASDLSTAEFSGDGKQMLTAVDAQFQMWDLQSHKPLADPLNYCSDQGTIRLAPDGTHVLTSSDAECIARLLDAATGVPLTQPLKHRAPVDHLELSPDGTQLLTSADDDTLRIWDIASSQPLTDLLEYPVLGGHTLQFSRDGRHIFAINTMSEDGHEMAQKWDLSPSLDSYPDWLLPLAEAISGKAFNAAGAMEPIKQDRLAVLNQIRERLNQKPDDNDWTTWGKWFLADPSTRTISPFSKITVPQYIESRIKENTEQSLEEAEPLAVGNAALQQRIDKARQALEANEPH